MEVWNYSLLSRYMKIDDLKNTVLASIYLSVSASLPSSANIKPVEWCHRRQCSPPGQSGALQRSEILTE